MEGPNVVSAAWSVIWARRVRVPRPSGSGHADHRALAEVLACLGGRSGLAGVDVATITGYLDELVAIDPDRLNRDGALAYWINLYNAAAVRLARTALGAGQASVLRVPGGFDDPVVTVAGESLSLNDIEHGKIRRFGDPRIHAALVCGSLSCPTLRSRPFTADDLGGQLEDQMRTFLASGGAVLDRVERTAYLSRIFLWYGADFVRPKRMPTLIPARAGRTLVAIRPWLPEELATRTTVGFQPYDWSLACAVE